MDDRTRSARPRRLDRVAARIPLPAVLARRPRTPVAPRPAPGCAPTTSTASPLSRRTVVLGVLLVASTVTALAASAVLQVSERTSALASSPPPAAPVSPSSGTAPAPGASTDPAVGSVLVTATLRADGSLDVVEQVRPAADVAALVLQVPGSARPAGQVGRALAGGAPRAVSVRLTADGRALAAPVVVRSTRAVVPLARAGQPVELRYRLLGSTVTAPQSRPGRALAAVGSIVAGTEPDMTLRIVLDPGRGHVLNLVCPSLGGRSATCAAQDGDHWWTVVRLRAGTFGLAQVDLPT
jgi:hypothetical protein